MNTALLVDIGNTSTSLALYRAGHVRNVRRILTSRSNPSSIAAVLRGLKFDRAVIASVVPSANAAWKRSLKCPTTWVNHEVNLGIRITYPKPATIGADRLANACGGAEKYGAPLIVLDFGTALTFDVVTKKAGYIGGVIAPGPAMMFSYLAEKTAKLPLIKPGAVSTGIGKSTRQAMRLGAKWGYAGMVQEILAGLARNPELKHAKLVATGGYAARIAGTLKRRMIVDQNLTLYGLGKISELNP